ncbi:hypothetical protein TeGR_g1362 [Tetraparma gracilis]|uniref:Uncharacterized protein n=1 Tax=Tetraparma gracilis TaxID=2962635 RepID=A0ABQ6MNK2_9STRA|nr:hypothetical protein TeGR_g1362 [Tetraparma gracilis]
MAPWIQRLPSRFIETFGGAGLNLTFGRDMKTFRGSYRPQSSPKATVSKDSASLEILLDPEMAVRHGMRRMSTIIGTVKVPKVQAGEDFTLELVGRWVTKTRGCDFQGPFHMSLVIPADSQSVPTASGFWSDDSCPGTAVPWSWCPDYHTSAFFDFIHSTAMTRASVLSAWLFLALTVACLASSLLGRQLPAGVLSVFDAFYVAVYGFFMVAFFTQTSRPSSAYILGVFLYLLGYLVFGFLTLSPGTFGAAAGGSLLFAVGSVSLLIATGGPGGGGVAGYFRKERTLFWGSFAFLLGSIVFAADSVRGVGGGRVGYTLFVAGRVLFLWGSTTDEVGLFLGAAKVGGGGAGEGEGLLQVDLT